MNAWKESVKTGKNQPHQQSIIQSLLGPAPDKSDLAGTCYSVAKRRHCHHFEIMLMTDDSMMAHDPQT